MTILSLHTQMLAGMFYLDLLIATLLYLAFENVVRAPLTKNLPQTLKARLRVYRNRDEAARFDIRRYIVLISLLSGRKDYWLITILARLAVIGMRFF